MRVKTFLRTAAATILLSTFSGEAKAQNVNPLQVTERIKIQIKFPWQPPETPTEKFIYNQMESKLGAERAQTNFMTYQRLKHTKNFSEEILKKLTTGSLDSKTAASWLKLMKGDKAKAFSKVTGKVLVDGQLMNLMDAIHYTSTKQAEYEIIQMLPGGRQVSLDSYFNSPLELAKTKPIPVERRLPQPSNEPYIDYDAIADQYMNIESRLQKEVEKKARNPSPIPNITDTLRLLNQGEVGTYLHYQGEKKKAFVKGIKKNFTIKDTHFYLIGSIMNSTNKKLETRIIGPNGLRIPLSPVKVNCNNFADIIKFQTADLKKKYGLGEYKVEYFVNNKPIKTHTFSISE